MNNYDPETNSSEIPTQIIKELLQKLTAEKVSSNLVDRLKTTLLKEGKLTETAIHSALFPEDKQS